MKNPRVMPIHFQESRAITSNLLNDIKAVASPLAGGLTGGIPTSTIESKGSKPLEKFLKALKFTEAEIGRMVELAGTVAAVASVVGWVAAAISTAKQVLTFLGILSVKDPVMEELQFIGREVQRLYEYLKERQTKGLYEEALGYRDDISTIRSNIRDIANSRSELNFVTFSANIASLQKSILKMLDPGKGNISFLRDTYKYGTVPHHWIDMATPFYMCKTDATNTGIDYQDQTRELAATIWDPGHYLDLLIMAIAVRLAAIEVTEPAFRSTGHNRDELINIHKGLGDFIEKWNGSFFVSRTVGPIDPNPFSLPQVLGGWTTDPHPLTGPLHHIVQNPFDTSRSTVSRILGSPSIALACVDPVTGLAFIEPDFRDGFNAYPVTHRSRHGESSIWLLDNYDQAISNANARLAAMMTELRARCGIYRFYDLRHSVFTLIGPPSRSEFVDLTDATFSSEALRLLNPLEDLDLGIIGQFAGKGGKKYPARRYHQHIVKKFRIPMARRADVSRIQLGYRMSIHVGGQTGKSNIVLCDFSKMNSPVQPVDFFPSGTREATITAPDAEVYDIIQSDVFSIAEEDAFEMSGSAGGKRRIYQNPRAGMVNLQIKVTFDFNINDNDQPFLGFANVEVSSVGVDSNTDGFIAGIDVYETVAGFDPGVDPPSERLADQLSLHFSTSFLVAPPDYFTDRDEGYAAMERIVGGLNERFAKSTKVGKIDPIAAISRQAQVETAIKAFAEKQLREDPHQMKGILDRLQVREPSMHR